MFLLCSQNTSDFGMMSDLCKWVQSSLVDFMDMCLCAQIKPHTSSTVQHANNMACLLLLLAMTAIFIAPNGWDFEMYEMKQRLYF